VRVNRSQRIATSELALGLSRGILALKILLEDFG
jgi:hypothetical protein